MAKSKSKKSKKKSGHSKSTQIKEPEISLYTGTGDFTLPNNDAYTGEFCAHRSGLLWRQGHGIYKTHDGQTYEGEWNDDKLVENKEIIVTYPNGVKYRGCIAKNKYSGPGTYEMEGDMNISCAFAGNKPTGTVALIDCDGKLWLGNAQENSAILMPENVFYLNLIELRGKGLSKEPIEYPSISTSSTANTQEEQLSDREWEKIIFAKSSLTDEDMEFTDCSWWKDYEGFRCKYDEIKDKIANQIVLNNDDYMWVEHFNKYKRKKQMEREEKAAKRAKEEAEVFALNEKFRSDDYIHSSPPVKVFYPTTTSSVEEGDFSEKISEFKSDPVDNENAVVIEASTKLPSKTLEALAVVRENFNAMVLPNGDNNTIISDDDQQVQFNELVLCSNEQLLRLSGRPPQRTSTQDFNRSSKSIAEAEETELHFTPFREQMLAEQARQMQEEKRMYEERQSKMNVEESSHAIKKEAKGKDKDEEKKKEKGKKEKGKKEDLQADVKDKQSVVSVVKEQPPPLDKKAKLEKKIKECVEKYLMERKERMAPVRTKVDDEKKKIQPHTHDTAAYTESITGLPRDLLL